jgi:hypothetical protein
MVQLPMNLKLIIMASYKRLLNCDIKVCKIHWFYLNVIGMILIEKLK